MNTLGGFGKIILFGEHFVVHGMPGIVASLPMETIAIVQEYPSENYILIDERPKIGIPSVEKSRAYEKMLISIMHEFGFIKPVSIVLKGTLPVCSGGIGSSAAAAVAITKTLNNYFKVSLNDEALEKIAHIGEKAVHGTPSGIDTAAAFGLGIFTFMRLRDGGRLKNPLIIAKKLYCILIDTGISSDTKNAIDAVNVVKNVNSGLFAVLCAEYITLFVQACKALQAGDSEAIGLLMNKNQELLKNFSLSLPEIDAIIAKVAGMGALGAKITGTGKGGLVLALAKDLAMQETIVASLNNQQIRAFSIILE